MSPETPKRFVSPIGKLVRPFVLTCRTGSKPPLIKLNRYPRQAIGFGLRLPRGESLSGHEEHYYLSFIWGKPARWWT